MSCAEALAREDMLIGRRKDQRYQLDLSARFVAAEANVRLQLEDISASGACVRLMSPRRLESGRLCWLQFEVYARILWSDGLRCGIQFDDPLPDDCLRQTIEFGELMGRDKTDRFLKLSSAWVHGPGDW